MFETFINNIHSARNIFHPHPSAALPARTFNPHSHSQSPLGSIPGRLAVDGNKVDKMPY